jgi:hypothetical protein
MFWVMIALATQFPSRAEILLFLMGQFAMQGPRKKKNEAKKTDSTEWKLQLAGKVESKMGTPPK